MTWPGLWWMSSKAERGSAGARFSRTATSEPWSGRLNLDGGEFRHAGPAIARTRGDDCRPGFADSKNMLSLAESVVLSATTLESYAENRVLRPYCAQVPRLIVFLTTREAPELEDRPDQQCANTNVQRDKQQLA